MQQNELKNYLEFYSYSNTHTKIITLLEYLISVQTIWQPMRQTMRQNMEKKIRNRL